MCVYTLRGIKVENEDKIVKFLAYDGKVNIVCANTTSLVEKARKIHDLSPVATAALGRTLTIGSIMGSNMKNVNDNLTIQISGNGPIGKIIVVANNFPKVRGYVENAVVDLPLREDGKLNVGEAVGKSGFLNIIKDIGLKEPYTGLVPLISGEIAEDFANYFAISEQKPSVVALGVLVDKNGVRSAGGYLLTLMPDAAEEDIQKIEESIQKCDPISKMLEKNMSLLDIAKKVTQDENLEVIEEDIIPIYECNCNKEKFERGILSLGRQEIEKIIAEQGEAEVVCHFCNKKYKFSETDLKKMIIGLDYV